MVVFVAWLAPDLGDLVGSFVGPDLNTGVILFLVVFLIAEVPSIVVAQKARKL